jgi:hypothetical protein
VKRATRLALVAATLAVAAGCLPIPPAPSAPQPTATRRVAVYGDSVGLTLGWYANEALTNRATYAGGDQRLGCGIGRGGYRWQNGQVGDISPCGGIYTDWANNARNVRPEVAVVYAGPWDTLLRLIPGDSQWRHIGDPVYDNYLLGEMLVATDTLTGAGVREVVWVVPPPMYIAEHSAAESVSRAYAWRDLISWVQYLRPDVVTVADQWAWSGPRGEDSQIRPDGVHFSRDGSVYTWRAWLLDVVLAA